MCVGGRERVEMPPSDTHPTTTHTQIITGFLGSGKTTLLNRLLREDHGERLAVIENEFGEASIDTALVAAAAPSIASADAIVTLANGCLCCTVRGDLIDAVVSLADRRDEFDRIVIETTGLASPRPIIETFAAVDAIARVAYLDGVVTLVDAVNAWRHLGEGGVNNPRSADPSEAVDQVAYADRLLLNKTDLVEDGAALTALEARLRTINAVAPCTRTRNADVPVAAVLGVGGFDLARVSDDVDRVLAAEAEAEKASCGNPAHGEPGHVCGGEHAHSHSHDDHEHTHSHSHEDGGGHSHSHSHSHEHAPHVHDDSVTSITVSVEGSLDLEQVNLFLGALVDVRADDLYRFKGVLSIAGVPEKFIFQGVHYLFTGLPGEEWEIDEKRVSRMVFIGKELPAEDLREGFEDCVVEADGQTRGRKRNDAANKARGKKKQGAVGRV